MAAKAEKAGEAEKPEKAGQAATADKARLFLAVTVPDEFSKRLSGLKKECPELSSRPLKSLHLTLRFLGDTDRGLAGPITEALRGAKDLPPPFEALAGPLRSMRPRPPAALAVTLLDSPELKRLKEGADRALSSVLGGALSPEGFLPYITIDRLKRPFSESLQRILAEGKLHRPGLGFEVLGFTLFESRLLPSGAVHTPLAQFSLPE
jgi:2'-5' RNA ligase